MRSILEKFVYGNISPENQYFKRNSAYGQAMSTVRNLIYGYKLSLLMTTEAFITSDSLISGEGDC